MEQQFEHLTDAQIEHYGEPKTGAGPQRNQQIEAQQIEAQQIESHLADCSACRTRLLEFHRARFTPSSTTTGRPGASRPDCPGDEAIRDLAAGLTPRDQAALLIQHAAECPHCGPLLRTYTEHFSDDLTPEEQTLLSQLKSSSPEWQKQLVRELQAANPAAALTATANSAGVSSRPIFKLPWFRRLMVPAAVAASAAIAFFVWYQQRVTPEKVEKLLAQAYTEQRTMEYRWPGAEWAPVTVSRGESSHLDRPLGLLDARKTLTDQSGSLNKPSWLRAKGETELAERQFDLAIKDLSAAHQAAPDSADVAVLLAIAYAKQDNPALPKALDLLSQALQQDPANRSALFNRALLYQRMGMKDKAQDDWNALLKIEQNDAWANEARQRMAELAR